MSKTGDTELNMHGYPSQCLRKINKFLEPGSEIESNLLFDIVLKYDSIRNKKCENTS